MALRLLLGVLFLALLAAPGARAADEAGTPTPSATAVSSATAISSSTSVPASTSTESTPVEAAPIATPTAQRLYSRVAPIEIKIPTIGLDAAVVPVGEDADGAMSPPSDPDTVAWYSLGPGTGGPGNIVLAGHVDWGGRLRTFGQLRALQPGDQVVIVDELAREYFYEVSWRRNVAADLDDLFEVFGSSDLSELTLITCGGPFDHSVRQYTERIIVRALKI